MKIVATIFKYALVAILLFLPTIFVVAVIVRTIK